MPRIALGLAYDGRLFHGWQTQPHGQTVQDKLETALASVSGEAQVATICAGRTDAGVHATGQVVHFDTASRRPLTAWTRGVNAHLPDGCAVQWACEVDDAFHARFGASYRRYQYWVYRAPHAHPLVHTAAWVFQPLDVGAMQQAMPALLGEHDFTSFRAAQCQAATPIRSLTRFELSEAGPFLCFTLQANAFLHHMARNLVGTLLEVGMGNKSSAWPAEVLAAQDRRLAAKTAPACGLTLVEVGYDAKYALPASVNPRWLADARVSESVPSADAASSLSQTP